jgi:hypothetical protein
MKLQRHLVKLLAIRNIIANGAEKIHCVIGMEKMCCAYTGGSGAKGFLALFSIAQSIICSFAMGIIAHCAIGNNFLFTS